MKADNGKRVKVQYVAQLDDGTVFSQTAEQTPLEFTLGQEKLIPGFVEAVRGMEPGEQKTVKLSPEKAFGKYDPEKLMRFNRNQFAKREPIEPGLEIDLEDVSGNKFTGRVDSFTDESVTVDANHPLAGQTVKFDIRLQEVA